MSRFCKFEQAALVELTAELKTVHIDSPSNLPALLPKIRAFLEVDNMLLFCPSERLVGWGLERLDFDNLPDGPRFSRRFAKYLAHAPPRFAFFNARCPEPEQRDRVVEAVGLIGADVFRASCLYREVLEPMQLGEHRQLRALVCDGASLLAWVGTFVHGDVSPQLERRLTALLPALRARLSIERLLRRPKQVTGALDLILDQMGEPTFVIARTGELVFANTSGRKLLDSDRGQTVEALQRVVQGTPDPACEIVPLVAAGMEPLRLVVLRRMTPEGQIARRVETAALRWDLTSRQLDVLRLVIHGHANATIAELLGVGERTIELHVTAMFDRIGVDSRAALISRVFLLP